MIVKHVHNYKFVKYIGGKCNNCGFHVQSQYQCSDAACAVTIKRKHVCRGKNARK